MEHMLTADVAAEFKIAEGTLRWWRHRGIGPRSFRVGRRVMYRREDVVAWLQTQYEAEGATHDA